MSEPVTALGGVRYDGLISIAEQPPMGMITLRGDLGDARFAAAARRAGGCDVPERRMVRMADEERGLLWMSPDELMVLCPYRSVEPTLAGLHDMLSEVHALAVDVSDARACFGLSGEGIREVLAKVAPADLSQTALPPGELRRTRLAQVPAAFWFTSETAATVICFRSVAEYVYSLLRTAAAPGSAVGFFT